jgi:hypothetical protein
MEMAMSDEMAASDGDRLGCGLVAFGMAGAASVIAVGITVAMMDVRLFPPVFVVTLAIVLGLGGLVFSVIRERPTWIRVLSGGFATGALIPALLVMISAPDSASVGGVATVVDGSYTWAGWRENLFFIFGFGFAGIVGSVLARVSVQWLLRGGTGAKIAIGGLILAAVAAIWLVPWATKDRSCHNTSRDGRDSIGAVASISLNLPMSEWLAVRNELDRFARVQGWEQRADVRPDPGFPWFQVSLCREPGTKIFIHTNPFKPDHLSIHVMQPQGGDSWQAPLRQLQAQIEGRWPGSTSYEYGPSASPRPPWAPPSPSGNAPLHTSEKSL